MLISLQGEVMCFMAFTVRKLRRYEEGFDRAVDNARRFHEDSQYLQGDGRLLSAALIGIYALDELGKACMIGRAALWPAPEQREVLNRSFKDHHAKLEAIHRLVGLFEGGFILPDDILERFVEHTKGKTWILRSDVAFVSRRGGEFVAPDTAALAPDCQRLLDAVDRSVDVIAHTRARIHQMFDDQAAAITAARQAKRVAAKRGVGTPSTPPVAQGPPQESLETG